MKRIDVSALQYATEPEQEDELWETFFDEWETVFNQTQISTAKLLNAIETGKIRTLPNEIKAIINRRSSPSKALGLKLRKTVGMMSSTGLVLLKEYDYGKEINLWKLVRVDPSTQL